MVFVICIPEDLFDMLYLRTTVTEKPHLEQALPCCMASCESGYLCHHQIARLACILHSVCQAHLRKTGSMTEVVTALLAVFTTMDLLLWLWTAFGTICSAHMYYMGAAWSTCGPQQSALVCVRILYQGQYKCLCANRQPPFGIFFRLHICSVATVDFFFQVVEATTCLLMADVHLCEPWTSETCIAVEHSKCVCDAGTPRKQQQPASRRRLQQQRKLSAPLCRLSKQKLQALKMTQHSLSNRQLLSGPNGAFLLLAWLCNELCEHNLAITKLQCLRLEPWICYESFTCLPHVSETRVYSMPCQHNGLSWTSVCLDACHPAGSLDV